MLVGACCVRMSSKMLELIIRFDVYVGMCWEELEYFNFTRLFEIALVVFSSSRPGVLPTFLGTN